MVAPVEDGCWFENRPGDRWNCKCSLQATDKGATKTVHSTHENDKPQPGLDNNPGVDGKIFGDSHPYITDAYKGAKEAVNEFVKTLDIEEPEPVKETNFKSGGIILIPEKFNQRKQEAKKNIKAYTELAKKYGEKYELLNVGTKLGVKYPDAINLKTGKTSDAKIPVTKNGKSAIQNSIKEASSQKVSEVYIYLDKDYSNIEIRQGLLAAFQPDRAKSIDTIIIRKSYVTITRYNADMIRNVKKHRGNKPKK
ncbi:MAG: hypothetical protein F8N15_03585 [Methanobacterium sp.]|nr:hypothetical protein [Methanobacterium sp.]